MRYELYSYHTNEKTQFYFYEMEAEALEDVLDYKEGLTEKSDERLVIIDNFSVGRIHHRQLGFQERPSLDLMIHRVFKCKLSKQIAQADAEEDVDCFYTRAFERAKFETISFFKMNVFLELSDIEPIFNHLLDRGSTL